MIQIYRVRRQLYITFSDITYVHDILSATNGETIYKHATGEISPVRLLIAGMGQKRVRQANLPPEIPHSNIRAAMTQFENVHDIKAETWAKHYRYQVSNGIK
jgi:hypothetical protein